MRIEQIQDMPDLELVRRFEAAFRGEATASPVVEAELIRRVARDGGWLVPGVALYLPADRGMERKGLGRPGTPQEIRPSHRAEWERRRVAPGP